MNEETMIYFFMLIGVFGVILMALEKYLLYRAKERNFRKTVDSVSDLERFK